jgi:hypothetical protein
MGDEVLGDRRAAWLAPNGTCGSRHEPVVRWSTRGGCGAVAVAPVEGLDGGIEPGELTGGDERQGDPHDDSVGVEVDEVEPFEPAQRPVGRGLVAAGWPEAGDRGEPGERDGLSG